MELYHVDTNKELHQGKKLEGDIEPPKKINGIPNEAIVQVNNMFPDGLTPHGKVIMYGGWQHDPVTYINEYIFELYRREYCPKKPSRLQSIFSFDSISEAKKYCIQENITDADIYRIDGDDWSGPHYMDHLTTPCFGIGMSQAKSYWEGFPNQGLEEYLVEPPVQILEEVEVNIESS